MTAPLIIARASATELALLPAPANRDGRIAGAAVPDGGLLLAHLASPRVVRATRPEFR